MRVTWSGLGTATKAVSVAAASDGRQYDCVAN